MDILAYTLRTGPHQGQVRPCLITREHEDKTLDVTVFLAHGDGLGSAGLLQARHVRPDYLGTNEKTALANASKSIQRELADAVAAAEQAQKAAEAARKQADAAGAQISEAQAMALRLEAAAETEAEKLGPLKTSAAELTAKAIEQARQARQAADDAQSRIAAAAPLTGSDQPADQTPVEDGDDETDDTGKKKKKGK